jgi:hypothetical protein
MMPDKTKMDLSLMQMPPMMFHGSPITLPLALNGAATDPVSGYERGLESL